MMEEEMTGHCGWLRKDRLHWAKREMGERRNGGALGGSARKVGLGMTDIS